MTSSTFTAWASAHAPPSPVPSPPPVDEAFASDVETHYYFHSNGTRLGHRLRANDFSLPSPSSSPVHDWQLSLTAICQDNGDGQPFLLRDLPAHLLPFFAYRDVAVYVTEVGADQTALFDVIYREWYPTRDRTVFNDGILKDYGPFFSSTIRVESEGPAPQPPTLLKDLVRWHVALSHHLSSLLPRFCALRRGPRLLARPGLTQEQLQALPNPCVDLVRVRYDYTPVMRRTFTQCFIWVEKGWEDKGVRLVVLDEDMLRRISSSGCEGLTRDMDSEARANEAATLDVGKREQRNKEDPEDVRVDMEASMNHISVWRGSLKDVMRAVVVGDETRKRGLREFNDVLEEWLGDGVNVGK
ncbi:uncharacterized protein N0V89_007913 [Didymosphaeria variabile]|uniref:Uncharacterized protein n=1 Tax=Didymosphaeria variabile TaxID=1932322 RepID=A0A9W8XK12_9PLEO|nr:uncharacterized protein N0V89_007913 [Didymosphaeria variabile]KAJ4352564.1 hypothetical protein N0V89_007913 [Didymosphaeria variabile]